MRLVSEVKTNESEVKTNETSTEYNAAGTHEKRKGPRLVAGRRNGRGGMVGQWAGAVVSDPG